MATKTQIDMVFDNAIAANTTDLQLSAVIPNGKEVTVYEFGGSANANDYFALQWGSGGSFTTIRASFGNNNFSLKRTFTGDGSKRFRLVRVNADVLLTHRIFVYVSAVVHDA